MGSAVADLVDRHRIPSGRVAGGPGALETHRTNLQIVVAGCCRESSQGRPPTIRAQPWRSGPLQARNGRRGPLELGDPDAACHRFHRTPPSRSARSGSTWPVMNYEVFRRAKQQPSSRVGPGKKGEHQRTLSATPSRPPWSGPHRCEASARGPPNPIRRAPLR
jgi:hypothetical protein